ncbi:hypothetical protein [Intestinibacter sp.]
MKAGKLLKQGTLVLIGVILGVTLAYDTQKDQQVYGLNKSNLNIIATEVKPQVNSQDEELELKLNELEKISNEKKSEIQENKLDEKTVLAAEQVKATIGNCK